MNAKYAVDIWESERGWGQRLDDTKYFDSKQEADDYVTEYSARNDEPTVPDWYMFARFRGLVELTESGKEV